MNSVEIADIGLSFDLGLSLTEIGYFDLGLTDIKEPQQPGKRKRWGKLEARCNLKETIGLYKRQELSFISFFKKSEDGLLLAEIKTETNVALFAEKTCRVLRGLLKMDSTAGWCLLCPPKRRHKSKNFASMVCDKIAEDTGLMFYEDAITAKNRARVNPVFERVVTIPEQNIICFDDILTTGSTLHAVRRLFPEKNMVFIVGINNN